MNIEDMVEDGFENFMADYELDPEGSLNDMLFELFVAGYEAALELLEEAGEDDSEEEDE